MTKLTFTKKQINSIPFYILLFFYVFQTKFVFLPVNTSMIISVFGIIALLYVHRLSITRDMRSVAIILLVVIIWIIFTTAINGELEFSFIVEEIFKTFLIRLIAAYFVVLVGIRYLTSFNKLIKAIVNVCFIQSIIIIFARLIPSIEQVLLGLQYIDDRYVSGLENGTRIYGLGAYFDIGSFTLCLSLICTVYLYFSEKDTEKYILAFIVQAIGGICLARTMFVGILVAALYFLLSGNFKNKKLKAILYFALIAICCIVIIYIFKEQIQTIINNNMNVFNWMFEFLPSVTERLQAGGKTTNSLTELIGQYVFPDNVFVWLFGEGSFQYFGSDPLYIRYLFCGGLILVILWIFLLYKMIKILMTNNNMLGGNKNFDRFLKSVFALTLVFYMKLVGHSFWLLFLMWWFFYFKRHGQVLQKSEIVQVREKDNV